MAGVAVSTQSVTVDEDSMAGYTLVLESGPTADVSVTVTRQAGGDESLSAAPTPLTFTAGHLGDAADGDGDGGGGHGCRQRQRHFRAHGSEHGHRLP